MGLHFLSNSNAIFSQWALRGRLPSSCWIFEPQTWEGRRQGNLHLLTLNGDVCLTPRGGVRDGFKEASVCCWEDSVPCHPFSSLNEVSSERGQWETSGETSSRKRTQQLPLSRQSTSAGLAAQAQAPSMPGLQDAPPTGSSNSLRCFPSTRFFHFLPSPFSFLQQSLLPTSLLCRNLPLLNLPRPFPLK